jgi:hypothetical protein
MKARVELVCLSTLASLFDIWIKKSHTAAWSVFECLDTETLFVLNRSLDAREREREVASGA